MSKASTSAQCAVHMSPAQAAQACGVSRWTVMRAINSKDLIAVRDNKNQWRITEDDLSKWRSNTVRTVEDAPAAHTIDTAGLHLKIAEQTARAELAEAMLIRERQALDEMRSERDRWQLMTEKLAEKPHRSWWPWKK